MPRMFIYGSCVSRDTKNYFSEDWKVLEYVARQSMISTASGPIEINGESALKSAFQNRMIQYDAAGSALPLIEEKADNTDLMLLDLVDERRGVWELAPGRYVTNSYEIQQSGLMKLQPREPRLIPFGSDEHFALWSNAARIVVDSILERDVPVFALTPPWALTSKKGLRMKFKQGPVASMNRKFNRYNARLGELGVPLVTVPVERVLADDEHRWGLNCYHFSEDVYLDMRDQVLAEINR